MDPVMIFALISAALAVLQKQPGLTGEVATLVGLAESAFQAALNAHKAAAEKVDPNALQPLPVPPAV